MPTRIIYEAGCQYQPEAVRIDTRRIAVSACGECETCLAAGLTTANIVVDEEKGEGQPRKRRLANEEEKNIWKEVNGY